ncbi:hypothetical protein DGo_PB0154 (plasmid) [Deinococcus gobiensis I-0]|uniref:Uncharacterized protein n=1 Tax=Deinococcus gobiensis (strain DSM 21396 / JCM 16679 / CGMCC 1.7299 / I-0) TaxID=745776 RepID=H8H1M6_DEIGI|nr:hypothetical protein DGo_PB0154 [Deinococcus gobiensis I-0]
MAFLNQRRVPLVLTQDFSLMPMIQVAFILLPSLTRMGILYDG